jgi:hypothetical protein
MDLVNMTNATQFRISTRPRLLLGTRIVDVIDGYPITFLAVAVAAGAGLLAALVYA